MDFCQQLDFAVIFRNWVSGETPNLAIRSQAEKDWEPPALLYNHKYIKLPSKQKKKAVLNIGQIELKETFPDNK